MTRNGLIAVGLAVAALAGASACVSGGSSGGSGGQPAPQSSYCVPESQPNGVCPGSGVKVSSSPQATNPGVGAVSGVCHFGIKGSSPDTTGDSGLKPTKMSPVLIGVTGVVWGYCTDTVHDFVIDLHIYGAPAGDAHGDFTKDPAAHEMSHSENSTAPGPVPHPFAVSMMSCVPGLEFQLVWYITATDSAGNFIGGGPFGGAIRQFTAAECGAAS